MIVIAVSDCPPKLRGDLTKWLCEINTGVYVGNLSARVREALWTRICENIGGGRATMVYSAANEQNLEFRTHNSSWKIRDFDGIKLMMHPKVEQSEEKLALGYSKASKRRIAERMRKNSGEKKNYVFVDIETTGLDIKKDKIIEIAAIEANDSEIVSKWSSLIKTDEKLPRNITGLTGITDETLSGGSELSEALSEFSNIVKGKTVVCYNKGFDIVFLSKAFRENHMEFPISRVIDALALARKIIIKGVENYKLETLADYFEIAPENQHRALTDCELLYKVFLKLNEN